MVTITDAKVTPDLREATLYYTVYGDDVARQETAQALESPRASCAAPSASRPASATRPSLTFIADVVPETAGGIEELLRGRAAEDARVQELAAPAAPAGDADPYRVPRVVDGRRRRGRVDA